MKKILFILIIFSFSSSFSQMINKETDWESLAREFIGKYFALDFDYCYAQFDSTTQSKFSKDLFKQAYSQTENMYGKFQKIEETQFQNQGGYHITSTLILHEKGKYLMLITYNDDKKIVGFFFKPYQDANSTNYTLPEYADTTKFYEKDIKFGKDYPLNGKISIPKNKQKVPIVILVHGSGPNDMDETIGPNKPFKDIAYGLSSNGISVLRYNKRTMQYNNEMSQIRDEIDLYSETIEDVINAFNFVKTIPEVDTNQIYILGHSLGGYAMPMIASKLPQAKGFIFMAAANQPLEDKMLEQYEYISKLKNNQGIDEATINKIKEQVTKVKNKDFGDTLNSDSFPLSLPPHYWQYLDKYKPLKLVKNIPQKMLFIQGERDYQVTMKELQIWKATLKENPKATFITYPKLNHLFLEGEGLSTPEEYGKESHIPIYVINDIVKWIIN